MRALTVEPGSPGTARLDDVPEPVPDGRRLLVQSVSMGVCGTDRDIVEGRYGSPRPGHARLVLGHELLGRVLHAPDGSKHAPGDLVAGIVRRPDPMPCPACAVGEWDMCQNGRYTEHGIKERDGFLAERLLLEDDELVAIPPALGERGVLLEPASVVAKAWDHIDHIGARAAWSPKRVLVTGAGPVGLLAALLATQRGYEVHVLDLVEHGRKPDLVRALGAQYHRGGMADACPAADVIVECTGASEVVLEAMACTSPAGIVCLTGLSSGSRRVDLDAGALIRSIVLENDVVFGSVNANRRHYESAARSLTSADPTWLDGLITRRVPLSSWGDAFTAKPTDVKIVVDVTS